jgi:hypothetical protein
VSILFLDDFNRAASATAGNGWSQHVISLANYTPLDEGIIKANRAHIGVGESAAYHGIHVWRPMTAYQRTVTVTQGPDISRSNILYLGVRGTMTTNALTVASSYGYALYWHPPAITSTNNLRIYRYDNGAITLIGQATITVAAGDVFALKRDGAALRAYQNGTEAVTVASDTTYMYGADAQAYNVGFTLGVGNDQGNTGNLDDFVFEIPDTVPIHLLRTHVYPSFL